jgi:hypothetical protein
MYSLLRSVPLRRILLRELPAWGISLTLAELYYKFGSFILECGAFLATWWLLSFLADKINFPRTRD